MSRRRARRIETDRRGVSETLGYVLVFSLVISTIGAVMIFGFSGLEDRQEVEQVNNAERAFDVLADNFDDMRRYEDPSRATEIRLAGGTLSLGENVTITVGQGSNGTLDPDMQTQTNVTLRPLVYESDGGIVVYEAGMVFRSDGERSLPRTSTQLVVTDSTAAVPAIVTGSGGSVEAISSDRTVLVSADDPDESNTIETIDAEGEELWIEIESPRADGWEQQLRSDGFDEVTRNDDRVAARLESDTGETPERVTLAKTVVDIEFR